MTQQQKTANIISRDEIKRTGVILYQVLSSNGTDKYYVTISKNEVFCECPGFNGKYGKCYHTRELVAIEGERQAEAKMAAYKAARETARSYARIFYSEY